MLSTFLKTTPQGKFSSAGLPIISELKKLPILIKIPPRAQAITTLSKKSREQIFLILFYYIYT